MAPQQLLDYIRQAITKGISIDEIKRSLLAVGWQGNEIDNAMNLISGQNISSQEVIPVPGATDKKMGRFRASYLLVVESFELLRKDKEIIFFPIFSAFFNLVALIILVVFFYTTLFFSGVDLKEIKESQNDFSVVHYVFIFATYLVSIFITTFFNAGLVSIVLARINGQDLSFKDGLRNAFKNIGKIFTWSLIAATIGTLMRIIFDRSKLLGKIIISILGATWGVLTFFIVPVLVSENKSPFESIKESGITFKRVWGETLITHFSMGLFFTVVYLLAFVAYIATLFSKNLYIIIISTIVLAIFFILTAVISSALNAIFKVVLYEYAKYGRMPANFTPELILNAIKKKS